MRLSAVAFLMILTTMFLSGCGQEQLASVEDKGSQHFARARSGMNGMTTATVAAAAVADVESRDLMTPAPVVAKASNPSRVVASQAGRPSPFGPASKPLTVEEGGTAPAISREAPKPLAQNTLPYPPVAEWKWPVNGKIIQAFGPQRDGIANQGITIAAEEDSPIRAAQSGEVAFVGNEMRDYGNMVILRHAGGTLSAYAHARNITVAKGQQVAAGSVIAYVGKSGSATSPQLHFAVREGDHAVDPMGKLPQAVASN